MIRLDARTSLTALVSTVWLLSFAVRIENPGWPAGPAADGTMLVIVSWWFASKATEKKRGGS